MIRQKKQRLRKEAFAHFHALYARKRGGQRRRKERLKEERKKESAAWVGRSVLLIDVIAYILYITGLILGRSPSSPANPLRLKQAFTL